MAVLYVAEFATIGGTGNFPIATPQAPPIAEQTISLSASSAAVTNAFGAKTNFVRLANDGGSAVSVAFGTTPTAVAGTNLRLATNQTEYFCVAPGMKVAAVNTT